MPSPIEYSLSQIFGLGQLYVNEKHVFAEATSLRKRFLKSHSQLKLENCENFTIKITDFTGSFNSSIKRYLSFFSVTIKLHYLVEFISLDHIITFCKYLPFCLYININYIRI